MPLDHADLYPEELAQLIDALCAEVRLLREIISKPIRQVPEYVSDSVDVALDQLAAVGKTAWADVPDAAGWVREVRGGAKQP